MPDYDLDDYNPLVHADSLSPEEFVASPLASPSSSGPHAQQATSGGGTGGGSGPPSAGSSTPPLLHGHPFPSTSASPSIFTSGRSRNPPVVDPGPFTPEMRDRQARGKDPYEMRRIQANAMGLLGGPSGAGSSSSSSRAGGANSGNAGGRFGSWNQIYGRAGPQATIASALLPAAGAADDFQRLDRRRHAAVVLDSPELLMMYAQSTGDSIPATRLQFMRMMCGYEEEQAAATAAAAVATAAAAGLGAGYGSAAATATSRSGRRQGGGGGGGGGSNNSTGTGKRKVPSSWAA